MLFVDDEEYFAFGEIIRNLNLLGINYVGCSLFCPEKQVRTDEILPEILLLG